MQRYPDRIEDVEVAHAMAHAINAVFRSEQAWLQSLPRRKWSRTGNGWSSIDPVHERKKARAAEKAGRVIGVCHAS